jgi:1,4-alpha-glucan branching enzyme
LTEHQITDFDLYLFGEGTHERIDDKLGAHSLEREGIPGTRFTGSW